MTTIRQTMALMCTMLAMLSAGCSTTDPHKLVPDVADFTDNEIVKLTIWGEPSQQELLKEMCEMYSDSHSKTHYAISFNAVDTEDCADEVLSDITCPADIFFFSSNDLDVLVSAEVLAPVDGGGEFVSGCCDSAILSAVSGGRLYGYPCQSKTCFLYYDSSKLTEQEAESLDLILQKDIPEVVYNIVADIEDELFQAAFFLAAGCAPYDAYGYCPEKCDYNNSRGFLAGEYMLRLATGRSFGKHYDDRSIKRGFANGSIAAAISCTDNCDEIKSSLGRNYAAAKLPKVTLSNGETVQLVSTAEYTIIGINKNSSWLQESMRLAEWLAGDECQRMRLEKLSLAPTSEKLMQDEKLLSQFPEVRALIQQLDYTVLQGNTAAFDEPAEAFAQDMITGRVTRANLQDALDEYVDSVLSEAFENEN